MRIALLCFLLAGAVEGIAQSGEILVSGKIREVVTGKGVRARITYKSMPTGSISGTITDSSYQFTVFGSSKYQIMVEADNYIPKAIVIDPAQSAGKGAIIKDVVVTPRGQTIRLDHLLFEVGKSVIDPSSFDELNEIALLLVENPTMVIQLEGHTDNTGNIAANLKLSQDRVDEVKKYLVTKKVGKSQVKTKAFGGSQPIVTGKTPEERERNRRVEMRVLSAN